MAAVEILARRLRVVSEVKYDPLGTSRTLLYVLDTARGMNGWLPQSLIPRPQGFDQRFPHRA